MAEQPPKPSPSPELAELAEQVRQLGEIQRLLALAVSCLAAGLLLQYARGR